MNVRRLASIIALAAACALLLAGCGHTSPAEPADGASHVRHLGKFTTVLGCYTDESGSDSDDYVCWVRATDGMTCLRSYASDEYPVYSQCSGGYADRVAAEHSDAGADDSSNQGDAASEDDL